MKNRYPILIVLILVSSQLYAQQWGGSSNQSGDISRDGNVSIVHNSWGITQLSILSYGENAGNWSSYWQGGGNVDGQTRILIANPSTGAGFTNGLYLGLDQAFAVKSYTIGSKDATPLSFYTSGVERFRISPNGNIGIGTTNPGYKFTVAGGDIKAYSYDNNSGVSIGSENTERPRVGFHVSDNSRRFKIELNGINSPSERLGFFTTNSGAWSETEVFSIYRDGNVTMSRGSFGTAQFTIANYGENPGNWSSYWQGGGNIDSQTRLLLLNPNAGTGFTNGLYIGLDQAFAVKSYTIGSKDATPLAFYTTGSERLRVTPNGNIGIGTTTPAEKLSVNGTIRSKEVKVEATGWPDYVFEPDYALPTLEETKAYIDTHKHLPDIPSAKEIEENGVALGEMNMMLLKKIEELTLYVIKLDSDNQELRSELNELKNGK